MKTALTLAKKVLLTPSDITEAELQNVLNRVLGFSVDFADLYFQNCYQESWGLEDGIVKQAGYHLDCGVGVRAISGEKTGFAYSDDLQLTALTQAAKAARQIAHAGGQQRVALRQQSLVPNLYSADNPLTSWDKLKKIAFLERLDKIARQLDPRVFQVNASLSGVYEVILMANTDGVLAADIRPLVRANVSVIVESGSQRQSGYSGGGCRGNYDFFLEENRAEGYAKEAVRQALLNLDAVDAPAGTMPVVLGPGWPGILLHEAIGHGLEGDFNRKGVSAFSGPLGDKVASSGVTVVDDGTLPNRRGSLTIDDEGTPTECTTLIENGILKGYMQDKLNARLMGSQSTGNCRRESYAHIPMPRMTNTYMRAGQYDPKEIIESVEKGIYAVNFGGGQVDITSGKFVFSASEAYLIEKGKVTKPVKGAMLIGHGPDVLTKVSMVSNDLKLDDGVGTCGKEGQSVPVGVGQPTLKVDKLTVGGTA